MGSRNTPQRAAPLSVRCLMLTCGALVVLPVPLATASGWVANTWEGDSAPASQPARPTSVGGEPFFASHTRAEVGRTSVVPFRLAAAAEIDTQVQVTSSDSSVMHIVGPAEVLKGESVGFVRIAGVRVGVAQLQFARGSLPVYVVPVRTSLMEQLGEPEIVSPAGGALAWGGFACAVQWMNHPGESFTTCELVLSDGTVLTPTAEHISAGGPFRLASFEIPASTAPGVKILLPRVRDAAGNRTRTGKPIAVRVVEADAERLLSFEAEEWSNAPRPDRWRRGRAAVGRDVAASGGAYVVNAAADPPVSFNFAVPPEADNAYYQMMLVCAGDIGGEALPTVGFFVDNRDQPLTQGSIAATAWHRAPIGVPVQLGAGRTLVTPRFENDFNSGSIDRNLRIDRIELLRIDGPTGNGAAPASAAAGEMSAMSSMSAGGMSGEAMSAGGMNIAAMSSAARAAGEMADSDGSAIASNPSGFFQRADWQGLDNRDTRLGWRNIVDGAQVAGLIELGGRVVMPQANTSRAPTIELLVDGKLKAKQTSMSPRFWVPQQWLAPMGSLVSMRARFADGRIAEAPAQHLMPAAVVASTSAPMTHYRWTMHDPAWARPLAAAVKPKADARELRTCNLNGAAPMFLALGDEVAGPHRIYLEGKGLGPRLPLKVTLTLRDAQGSRQVGTVEVPSYDGIFDAGLIDLPAGEKNLELTFDTLPKKKNKEGEVSPPEPRLSFESLIAISESAAGLDFASGTSGVSTAAFGAVSIVRTPSETLRARGIHRTSDALVVQAHHLRGVRTLEVLVNGEPTGVSIDTWLKPGPFVLPLLAREMRACNTALGAATENDLVSVSVRAWDGGWQTMQSAPVEIRISDQTGAGDANDPTQYERAINLLSAIGYGPGGHELAAVLTQGAEKFVRRSLTRSDDTMREQQASMQAAVAAFPRRREDEQTVSRGLLSTVLGSNPLRERFTHFVANHFTTWVRKVDGDRKWDEHERFLSLGCAPFADLLSASAHSSAMLLYLDQTRSFATRINENYARELLELHTVGVRAGYEQADVTALAKLLTGWSSQRMASAGSPGPGEVRNYEFRYEPRLNDPAEHRIFGLRAAAASEGESRYDRVRAVLEMLAAHPESARFICTKLADHYVSQPASPALVDELVSVFHRSAGDMSEVMVALALHVHRSKLSPRLAHPLPFAMRLFRTTDRDDVGGMAGYLRRSRAGLFDCATPDGYSQNDADYADTNAMIQRWKLAREMQHSTASLAPGNIRWAKGPMSDREMRLVVDTLAIRLTGRTLSDESTGSALSVMRETTGTRDEQIRELASLMGQLPELNLR